MLNLGKTLYILDTKSEEGILKQIKALENRIDLLRSGGVLTEDTLRHYYGEKRFEQVAESNALEGSTLSVGETELAVLKGITITGHDLGFIRDARALDAALQRLRDMAREVNSPTDIKQLHELHGLILGDRPGGRMFRREPVRIKGSSHVPPKSWEEIMRQMEDWEQWSKANQSLPAPIRAIVLHAWLVHIHPFVDGNGRTARAITNLELVRAGYPPIILRKKERERYIESLSESDIAGDLRSFYELIIDRIEGALTGLEISAKAKQGYSPFQAQIRKKQEQHLHIWDTSVQLLISTLDHFVHEAVDPVGGDVFIKAFDSPLDLEDYISLCERKTTARSWVFITNLAIAGFSKQVRLAYLGYRSPPIFHRLGDEGGPSIFWSKPNPSGYPKWIPVEEDAPFGVELTIKQGAGDEWYARKVDGSIEKLNTTSLAKGIANSLVKMATNNQ